MEWLFRIDYVSHLDLRVYAQGSELCSTVLMSFNLILQGRRPNKLNSSNSGTGLV